jgi:Tfp pilus assembly protein PilF
MKREIRTTVALILAGATLLLAGCASTGSRSPYANNEPGVRNTIEAQRLTREAAKLIEADPDKAEDLLREALVQDIYHGPAHNNLGVVYLQKKQLYDAANEFEWARKLMPGNPDPRVNLGLTLERAGRVDEAMAAYETALEVASGEISAIEAMARFQLRYGRDDGRTKGWLEEIALRSSDETWRSWAREKLALARPE